MLKNLFSKKPEDKEEPNEGKESAPRPKIVIKQRRPSNAPLPNGIANAMSPHSMPREDSENRSQQHDMQEEEPQPASETTGSTVEPQERTSAQVIDPSPYEIEIAALKAENGQLHDKTMLLTEESRGLHAALDSLEKSSNEEISNLKETIAVQEKNYSALEDEFLQQKEDLDELQDQLEQLDQDHHSILNELEDLQSISVPKKDLLSAQAKLREETNRKEDFESQTISLKKDQARYEKMVSELSAHITELKDSVDKGADEQVIKLMEVKDQELEMMSSRINELEKLVKDHSQEKKEFQQLINDKESLIETYQEYEVKYIDAQEAEQELQDALSELQKSHNALEDQLSLKTADLENVSPKITELEKEIVEQKERLEATILSLGESEKLATKLQADLDEANKEWDLERTKWKSMHSSASDKQGDYEAKIKMLSAAKDEIETAKTELEVKMQETLERLGKSDTENETLSAMLAEKEAILNSSQSMTEKSSEQMEQLQQVIAELTDQLESKKSSYATEKEMLEEELANLRSAAENSDDTELIEDLQKQLAEKAALEQEWKNGEEDLRIQIEKLETQLNDQADDAGVSEALSELQEKYDEALEREKTLLADIDSLKNTDEEVAIGVESKEFIELRDKYQETLKREEVLTSEIEALKNSDESTEREEESQDFSSLQEKYNDLLKREKALLSDIESITAKFNILETEFQETKAAVIESPEVEDEEVKQLRNTLQEFEAEQDILKAKIVELEALNHELSQKSSEVTSGGDAPAAAITYVINLVMKPDNDEYELELPGSMNGREIKTELTEAGLLEEGGSYDLFLPNQDAYMMNDEMLSSFNIEQGETLEIIPG